MAGIEAHFVPGSLPPVKAGVAEDVALVLRSDKQCTAKVTLNVSKGIVVTPPFRSVSLKPNINTPAFFKLQFTSNESLSASIKALVNAKPTATMQTNLSYDLEAVSWKKQYDKDNVGVSQSWMKPEVDDSAWGVGGLPSMWLDTGDTYLRTKLFIPESWRGKDVYLRLKAVDDKDVSYLNGIEIGKTDGWDTERNYLIDPKVIKYNQDNLLCIAVYNGPISGGGIYRSPSSFGIAKPVEKRVVQPKIAPAGSIGSPLPLRRIYAKNGVLYYKDGGEVALWGVNYYPQSWHQFDNMKRLGVDMKKAIRDDLDDMKRMGVEMIRIHVFDREISDAKGNIIDNEHLDLLDYLVSEASKRNIYFFFTPIAWWWGPNQNPDSFSARAPKEYMFCDDETIAAEANYVKNWLNRTNRYTGRRYKDEPAICVFEIMNEPGYIDYSMMMNPDSCYYKTDMTQLTPFKTRLQAKWNKWCSDNNLANGRLFFPLFRYRLMSHYLDTMYKAIRSTGATQPVACALFDVPGQEDLINAVSDSKCEAVTTGTYAGAWDKVGDGWNYLPWADNTTLDPRFDKKARLVYEFDGIKTFGSYFYPPIARRFRNLGVQIAAMFQYDSSTTAEWNTDWDAHYLNLRYTPGKAVSFYEGAKVFHDLARGASFSTPPTEQLFGNCAVSFDKNISIYSNKSTYISSASCTDWKPLAIPEKPELIMGVGNSPFVSYSGTGIYTLKIDYPKRSAELTVNPDAEVVGDPWHPSKDKSAVVLKNKSHLFTLNIPGVSVTGVSCQNKPILYSGNTFEVSKGDYIIKW